MKIYWTIKTNQFFFHIFLLTFLFLSCGIPNDEPVLKSPLITSSIYEDASGATFVNEPVTGDDYSKEYAKGYNFYYRIYSESQYLDLGSTTKDKEERILKEAVAKLTQANQIQMISYANAGANKFDAYFKMIKLDDINNFSEKDLSQNHTIALPTDFEESGEHVKVEYEVEFPSDSNGFMFSVVKKSRANQPISNPQKEFFFRRVYDPKSDINSSYAAPKGWGDFGYRDNLTTGKIIPDEDISKTEIEPITSKNYYYITYFVSVTGFWATQLKQLYSDVSLLGIQKVQRELNLIQ